jgi:hydroxymethylbilane synthase
MNLRSLKKRKMKQTLRIGSRGSKLALWQAGFIESLISGKFPKLKTEKRIIKTTGDREPDSPLSVIGGKGVFVKEIEESLLKHEIDIAVHSLKDLPTVQPDGLKIGAVSERHDPRDAVVSNASLKLVELKKGSRIGTGSLRRQAQILHHFPDLDIASIRGNVDTRIRKLKNGEFDAIVLAVAGVRRLDLAEELTEICPIDFLIPAPGQGILAIECRDDDDDLNEILPEINHLETSIAASAERSFLLRIGGDCNLPAGCYASIKEESLSVLGFLSSPDGADLVRKEIRGSLSNHKSLGKELAEKILSDGGDKIISKLTA